MRIAHETRVFYRNKFSQFLRRVDPVTGMGSHSGSRPWWSLRDPHSCFFSWILFRINKERSSLCGERNSNSFPFSKKKIPIGFFYTCVQSTLPSGYYLTIEPSSSYWVMSCYWWGYRRNLNLITLCSQLRSNCSDAAFVLVLARIVSFQKIPSAFAVLIRIRLPTRFGNGNFVFPMIRHAFIAHVQTSVTHICHDRSSRAR